MRNYFWGIVLLSVVFISVSAAQAKFAKPEEAIAYRKAVMVMLSNHFGRIGAVIKGEVPYQPKEVSDDARLVQTLSTLAWEAFSEPGSDKGATHMKSSVFSKPEQFTAAAKKLEDETTKLSDAAAANQLELIKTQFGKVAQSCKGCHEQFTTH